MSLEIPWEDARAFAEKHRCDQIIVWGYSKAGGQCVATWGKTVQDSDQAAVGGNHIKKALLGWPDALCNDQPDRVLRLKSDVEAFNKIVRCCADALANRRMAGLLIEAVNTVDAVLKELFPEERKSS